MTTNERNRAVDKPIKQKSQFVTRRRFTAIALAGTAAGAIGRALTERVQAQEQPRILWRYGVDAADEEWGITGSPTIVDGVTYIGGNDGVVYALDTESGGVVWRSDAGTGVHASPCVRDGTVYVGSSSSFLAYEADTGEELWRRDTADLGGHISSPVVHNDRVFTGAGWNTFASGGHVLAMDTATGDELWRFPETPAARVLSSPVVTDDRLFVGVGHNDPVAQLFALNPETGDVLWHYATDGPGGIDVAPTVAYGNVYVGDNDGSFHAIDATSGEVVWRIDTRSGIKSSATVLDETVYVANLDGDVLALDTSTGDERWRTTLDNGIRSSPTVTNAGLYIGTGTTRRQNGAVYALERQSGQTRWRFDPVDGPTSERKGGSDAVASSPTVADGTLYVASHDGYLHALDLENAQSSRGTRVLLAALGHTDHFAENGPTLPASMQADDNRNGDAPNDTASQRPDEATPNNTSQTGAAEDQPGLGVAGGIAGIAGGIAAASRWLDDD